ncbi:MAG: hypothetical protein M1510_08605 [Nitrospirae bacterium]|nr:hypothetical protein [Nitrospirota bacterium]MCL5238260.1 hypothetical protein [Nitrospirota bacterium]
MSCCAAGTSGRGACEADREQSPTTGASTPLFEHYGWSNGLFIKRRGWS